MRKTLNDFLREALLSNGFRFFYEQGGEYGIESCKEIINEAFLEYLKQEHSQSVKNICRLVSSHSSRGNQNG